MSNEPKTILILSLSGIGNFIMQSPVFEAIKKNYPNAHVTVWVAPRGTKELAENNKYIDEVIQAPIKNPALRHFTQIRKIQQTNADIGIVLSPGQLWKSSAYLYLAGIKQRIGNTYPFRGNKESAFLLTDAIKEQENMHDIEQNLKLLKPLNISHTTTNYSIDIPENAKIKAHEIINNLPIPNNKKLIGLHAGSANDFKWKRWPKENFVEVGKTLIQQYNAHILIFGGQDEKEIKEYIKQELGNNASIIKENLLTTAAIMKKCTIFLSNDSGMMHLAAATGIKTFGLFGPTDERKTGPRGEQSFVIRAPNTKPIYDTEKNYTLGEEPHKSILAITPKQVLDTIRQ